MSRIQLVIESEKDVEQVAVQVFALVSGRKKFALSGDLGAGKTTFVKVFCRLLGVKDNVSSPTFSLVQVYEWQDGVGEPHPVYHLDLYRLRSEEEAQDMGIEEYLYDDCYCFIEWPEVIATLMPDDMVYLRFVLMPDSTRNLTLDF